MANPKALRALALIEDPSKAPKSTYQTTVRIPGEVAERIFAVYDLTAEPGTHYASKNDLLVAIVEAGLEAIEAAAAAQPKGKKHA